MTQTPYILWAVLATGLGITVGLGWIRCAMMLDIAVKRAWEWHDRAGELAGELDSVRSRAANLGFKLFDTRAALIDAEDRLRKIEQARHQSAKHARAAQIAQQRAKVLEQASKLVAPKVDRIAA